MSQCELIKLRGRAKGSITRLKNYLQSAVQFNKEELIVRQERLEEAWTGFIKYDSELPDELSELEDVESEYLDIKASLRRALDSISTDVQSSSGISLSNNAAPETILLNNVPNLARFQSPCIDFKLPRLNIQPFSGSYITWPSFKDLFCTAVHNHDSLSKIQKFQYLRGLLSDEAEALIRHIPVSEASYDEAWDKLLQRYDRKKHIVNALIQTFLDQTKVSQVNEISLRQIADTSDEVIRGLKVLDENAATRDPWLIYILLDKLDIETRQQWAQRSADEDFPTFDSFIKFLNNRCSALEMFHNSNHVEEYSAQSKSLRSFVRSNKVSPKGCLKCGGSHPLYKCIKFKTLDITSRKNFVRKNSLCFNCLGNTHQVKDCISNSICHFCNKKHHSSLHDSVQNNHVLASGNVSSKRDTSSIQSPIVVPSTSPNGSNISFHTVQDAKRALLPTAMATVLDSSGKGQQCRLLLDSGSEISFISESCVQRLGLQRKNARFSVKGLAATEAGITRGYVNVSLFSNYKKENGLLVKVFILNKLTAPLPSNYIDSREWDYLDSLPLADTTFAIPKTVDIIIGADYFFSLLRTGQIIGSENSPIAQNTLFGWVLSGKVAKDSSSSHNVNIVSLLAEVDIDATLKRFWEVEDLPQHFNDLNDEEEFCENHFKDNYYINDEGRFVVKLPFYHTDKRLGNSKPAAVSRLLTMEKKFKQNEDLSHGYKEFMREYETLGHMSPIENELPLTEENVYYLPHHAVIKPDSTTTKLRVVFDASCRTSNLNSLNSVLGVGSKIQRDIYSILLSFRLHEFVFSADIEKMYRQVLVAPEDQNFQRIFWRYSSDFPIKQYKLHTVTYGTASAPFLATRALKQIAIDCEREYPRISTIIKDDFYMEDLLTGVDNLDEAVQISSKLSELLEVRGFKLRKWKSNSAKLLEIRSLEIEHTNLKIQSNEGSKVLGLHWNSNTDTFLFEVSLHLEPQLTKRNILSQSARIYDPLGFLSPCTIVIKMLYQQLWLENIDWDSRIPLHLSQKWIKFQEEFKNVKIIKIPRWIGSYNETLQLHGFCDASERAYAAVIYCRQRTTEGKMKVTLLVAKTKVAPIKQITIPRLELNAALLLARLFLSLKNILSDYSVNFVAWTDSKIVLSWLTSHPRRWKTFVANRTSEILDIIPRDCWHHISSNQNPADVASRGISPQLLPDFSLWWHGPSWLAQIPEEWPKSAAVCSSESTDVISEEKVKSVFCILSQRTNDCLNDMFDKFSSLTKIVSVLGYCKRFITSCKIRKNQSYLVDECTVTKINLPLSLKERNDALKSIITWVQDLYFSDELKCIQQGRPVKVKSSLLSLCPFIDQEGILRVGGRLQNSSLAYDAKHPIILPSQHKISSLIVKEFHITHLHAGLTLLSSILKQKFWIIGAKKLIRSCIYKCSICHRFKAAKTHQLMGELPEYRVNMKRPFFSCGVDYAGPVTLKFSKGRGAKTTKGYIALFICLSTKAVHIEAVSDLTADTFIASLRRFSSRRGSPRHIYCDNGTNFVGAKRKLSDMERFIASVNLNESISYYLNQSSIEWHMIPPASPHFGGIWESGVRSMKFHIKRVIGETILTFEELSTLLSQIEAILNLRPLTPVIESDIACLDVLTPAHFLGLQQFSSVPETNYGSSTSSYRNRWELIQKMKQSLWKRWHKEYLNSLQQRVKWKTKQPNVVVGDVVLLREDNMPVNSWPLGRVLEIHPGKDNLVRVVTVKTVKGKFKRSIVKLVKLPFVQDFNLEGWENV